MNKIILIFLLLIQTNFLIAQNANHGIIRKNYFSYTYDSILQTTIQVLDSSTIRLGALDPITGNITNVGNNEYNSGISLAGATINPYSNNYIISSGTKLLSFNLNNGNIVSSPIINGALNTSGFQNYRFNLSDSTLYGFVPYNFYSYVFDPLLMDTIQVFDSSHIRFATINPVNGTYSLLGNTPLGNIYSLAGNAIDPHQMLFYYSAVDTFVSVDLYTGSIYNQIGIQLPNNAYFENFTYSCSDTSIYGITRQNYISSYYDSILQVNMTVVDSTTFKLSKINPNTGVVTFISPYNIGFGGSLNGGCFIDPNSMIYYLSNGSYVAGISLTTGLVVTNVLKTYQNGGMYFDMMRNTTNCYGALKVRPNTTLNLNEFSSLNKNNIAIEPNPSSNLITIKSDLEIKNIKLYDFSGKLILSSNDTKIDISKLANGVYLVNSILDNGKTSNMKFIKN